MISFGMILISSTNKKNIDKTEPQDCFCVMIVKIVDGEHKKAFYDRACGYKYKADAVIAKRREYEKIYSGTNIKVYVQSVSDSFCN